MTTKTLLAIVASITILFVLLVTTAGADEPVTPKKKPVIVEKINSYEFCSSIKQKNILGTQFHPEKSHINGLNILKLLKKQI